MASSSASASVRWSSTTSTLVIIDPAVSAVVPDEPGTGISEPRPGKRPGAPVGTKTATALATGSRAEDSEGQGRAAYGDRAGRYALK
ncbi:hypothetical protein GCM10010129_26550 [Streptomyces fumigatiscleroticus]|nr:hypothetical protein GCM10010129_26550 [Streptomyces fumigatiscleroticus]